VKSQSELFRHVWETRKHVSEVSGEPLLPEGHPQWHWQFAHVLSKGAFPRYRLNPENIMLMLPAEHERQEQFESFNQKKIKLKKQYHEGY
jgi:hypothetical protein